MSPLFFILSSVLFFPQKIVARPVLPQNFLDFIDRKCLQKRLFK